MTISTDVATRNGSVAHAAPGSLAIHAGQTAWEGTQLAALAQLGLKDAPEGDRAVFLHQCQRTGLDPFARQIYMIGRNEKKSEKVNGQWVEKWSVKYTIQTGIEGWRVIRDRAERREGVRGTLSRFTYYDYDDNERKVWTRPEPPAAVEVTYTVRDRNGVETPYTSILRFREYVQTKGEGEKRVMVAQWATKPVHMLEKCTEADVYRKAFPQDFSGIYLDDAMPVPDPDEPQPAPPVQRVTSEQIRARRPQQATATVVAPDSSPAPAGPPAATADPPQQGAGEDPTTSGASSSARVPDSGSPAQTGEPSPSSSSGSGTTRVIASASAGQVGVIRRHFERLGYTDSDDDRVSRLSDTAKLAGYEGDLHTTNDLTAVQAARVTRALVPLRTAQDLVELLKDGTVPGGE